MSMEEMIREMVEKAVKDSLASLQPAPSPETPKPAGEGGSPSLSQLEELAELRVANRALEKQVEELKELNTAKMTNNAQRDAQFAVSQKAKESALELCERLLAEGVPEPFAAHVDHYVATFGRRV